MKSMLIRVSKFHSSDEAILFAIEKIDAAAEQARLKYLTPGSGQAMEYEEAHRQALEFISNPRSGHYPMLEADVEAGLCETVEQAASTVIAMRQQWEQVGQAIRRIRLEAKRRIRESGDPAEIARIREEAVSLLSGL
ncbi:hypothetical protein [Ectothiorhodospira shaposhnikovii]|uniref:hypothetical protein n=1 Tax=Ectothiorhodospira shaposhnikovii TaxID=1054 RepID=UPI001EE9A1E7|nr:hypothetical protein [Ectothiorhodospira shaposhnikovii]MCG5512868.1 hypothetical protein [Ectothiorhodospira shaposhnikovii]